MLLLQACENKTRKMSALSRIFRNILEMRQSKNLNEQQIAKQMRVNRSSQIHQMVARAHFPRAPQFNGSRLAWHPALSTDHLGRVAISCGRWRMCTGPHWFTQGRLLSVKWFRSSGSSLTNSLKVLKEKFGLLLILSFWRKWALWTPTNRFPLVWEKSSNGNWLKTAFEKTPTYRYFTRKCSWRNMCFQVRAISSRLWLTYILRLTRALCRSLVVEGSVVRSWFFVKL